MKEKAHLNLIAAFAIVIIAIGACLILQRRYPGTRPQTPVVSAETKGKQLYSRKCLNCHNKGMSTRGVFSALNGITNRLGKNRIIEVIRNGDASGVMPAFKRLKQEEIENLLSYLTTLKDEQKVSTEQCAGKTTTLTPEAKTERLCRSLYCPCGGCERTHTLQDCKCGTASEVKGFVLQQFRDGKTSEDVRKSVIEEYGQAVLPLHEINVTLAPERFAKIPAAYKIARKISQTLSKVPCFCGKCARLGHECLLDCFKSPHASKCEICVEEAIFVSELQREGSRIEEINREVTNRFYKDESM